MALMTITTVLTGVNIALVLGLIYIYAMNLRRIRSNFTAGLMVFALLFLVQNVASMYYFLTMMPLYAQGLEVHVFVITMLQTLAFGILNILTWK